MVDITQVNKIIVKYTTPWAVFPDGPGLLWLSWNESMKRYKVVGSNLIALGQFSQELGSLFAEEKLSNNLIKLEFDSSFNLHNFTTVLVKLVNYSYYFQRHFTFTPADSLFLRS